MRGPIGRGTSNDVVLGVNLPDNWRQAIAAALTRLQAEPGACIALGEVFDLIASPSDRVVSFDARWSAAT